MFEINIDRLCYHTYKSPFKTEHAQMLSTYFIILHWLQECDDVDRKLVFLNKRFRDAESSKWEGMFKKQPLW